MKNNTLDSHTFLLKAKQEASFFASTDFEKGVISELADWAHLSLNVPNEFFNNLPPCPFARQAWTDQKVAVVFDDTNSWQSLYSCVSQFDDSYDMAILVRKNHLGPPEDLHEYLGAMNEAISQGFFIDKDIWLMGCHPEDGEAEFVDKNLEFEEMVEEPYLMVFIQRLSKIQEAAYKLVNKGYYDKYMKDPCSSEQYAKRESYYLRLGGTKDERPEKTETSSDATGWFTKTHEERGSHNVRLRA